MNNFPRIALSAVAVVALVAIAACGPPTDPEIVALSYIRATSGGDPDTAVQLLDLEGIASRVEAEVIVVDPSGNDTFLEDSIESLLWGLFRETRPIDYAYNATPAELDGDTGRVEVTRTDAEEFSETLVVHLRNTDAGWRVSGASLDPLVRYVIQRLQEKY
jgi:hypothetical protein